MKVCAVICELNPPHLGHKYLFDKAREESKADCILAIMSGDFVQRGEPSILPTFTRAKLAIELGADLVVMMPTLFSTACAEIFASAGIYIASSIKNVTHICFGIEHNDASIYLKNIFAIAKKIKTKKFDNLIKKELKITNSFAQAKTNAIKLLAHEQKINDIEKIISTPNNLLGFEYICAMVKQDSNIIPLPIKRNGTFLNASKIRSDSVNNYDNVKSGMTENTILALLNETTNYQSFNKTIFSSLLLKSLADLRVLRDSSEELANKFYKYIPQSKTLEELQASVKSKNINFSKIKRIGIASLLNLLKCNESDIRQIKYLKVLALKDKSILKNLNSTLPLILRKKDADLFCDLPLSILDDTAHRIFCTLNNQHYINILFKKFI